MRSFYTFLYGLHTACIWSWFEEYTVVSKRNGLIVFSVCFSSFSVLFFMFFPLLFFAFASAGSALQALGAAERAGDEAPKPA